MPRRKAKIQVVEDDRLTAEDIKGSLEAMGYEVTGIVAYGEKAVERVAVDRPDVVLMDIVLRGEMDGIEAASRVRSQYSTPVIFLTAYSEEGMLERARLVEPYGYIIKPFEVKELEFAIEMALYKSRVERERSNLVVALRAALEKVRAQSSSIPICALRKKSESEKDLGEHIAEHHEHVLKRGVCEECLRIVKEDLLKHVSL